MNTITLQSMNYGETLVYWYLRLNGFFPLNNFVLHQHEETIDDSADCDVLAVRHPHAYEIIGGQKADWDPNLSEQGINLCDRITGIIVEVKTGQDATKILKNTINSFSSDRIRYAVQRLGFWPQEDTPVIEDTLNTRVSYQDDTFQIFKLLVSDRLPRSKEPERWKQLSLSNVENFIVERLKKHCDKKYADRLRFPSDLMQYMIWKTTTDQNGRTPNSLGV
ncbi:hypothetical protein [Trichlorobacter ammonificans]|uniref:hypothetical protein n=1 Tax=Trichlorobacter ammonificans TaxID=2916410 RepID=UPI002737DF4E|nr:hypothetical protein [Trichlorobacter ammonificans]